MEFFFWASFLLVFYIYIGYPLLIELLSMIRTTVDKSVPNKNTEDLPSVSILIAAYNEEKDIKDTLVNKIKLDYPREKLEILVVSDESTDATDEIVESIAKVSDINIRLFRQKPRQGKTSGLNLIVPEAKGEIMVFSDANSIYGSDALLKLVENFSDAKIGYVTGKMVYTNPDGSLVGDGCSSYMEYENWIREVETSLGSVVGVDGGIDAMRKSLYENLRADQLPDFVQPLKVVEKGYRVIYEPTAILKEDALSNSSSEYAMRVRVTLRALWALKDMYILFNPFKYGLFSLQLFSHKLLRYLAFVPIVAVFLLNVLLYDEGLLYQIMLTMQIIFYLLALQGKSNLHKQYNPAYYALPYYFALLNISCMHAFWRFIKGEKQATWNPRVG